jgi:probable addiction module antidote protein
MAGKIKISDLPIFDAAKYLDSPEAIAGYLSAALEENDPDALIDALGTVARARGMSEIAEASGLGRESLYKSLRADAQPRFDTVQRVMAALGLKLTVEPAEAA